MNASTRETKRKVTREETCRRWALTAMLALAPGLLLTTPAPAQDADLGLLVSYSFDEERLDSGPDTFAVFESSKGSVNLSSHYRLSGYNAIEIRDVGGDHDFPELQGYFPVRDNGRLWGHFGLMLTDPQEELNIALAGPQWFRLGKGGIAFWLTTRNGYLVHVSDSIPKKIFQPAPFVWYHVDLEIDLEAGVYDLRIEEEGSPEAIVELLDQPNASSQPGSAVDKFSFIGDRGQDTSNVVYYVDDVALAVGEPVGLEPFIAPGRRRLFVDVLDDLRDEGTAACVPALDLADFGVTAELARELRAAGSTDALAALAGSRSALTGSSSARSSAESSDGTVAESLFRARRAWSAGCSHLARGDIDAALEALGTAVDLVESSRVYEAAYALALAHSGHTADVDEWLVWLEEEWADDPRLLALLARVAIASGDAEGVAPRLAREAYAILDEQPANEQAGSAPLRRRRPSVAPPQASRPSSDPSPAGFPSPDFPSPNFPSPRRELLALEYFALLLWQEHFDEAQDFALAVAAHLEAGERDPHRWLERAGDAAFHAGDHGRALALYERLLSDRGTDRVLLKLSDVHFRRGDLDAEREFREAIYGRLSFD